MKKIIFTVVASTLFSTALYAQPPIRISWTGELNCKHYRLDSVTVTNTSNGENLVFHYPDTILMYGNNVGIKPIKPETETGLKIYPNPFADHTQVDFSLSQSGEVDMTVYDFLGREIIRQCRVLGKGTHRFKINLPQGTYTLNLQTAGGKQSARLLSEGKENVSPQIVYSGTAPPIVEIPKKVHKSNDTDFPFEYGDTLILQGFIADSDVYQYKEEHLVPLIEDTHVIFKFFNELACIDTSEVIVLDSFKNGGAPCYYSFYEQFEIVPQFFPFGCFMYGGAFMIVNTQSDLDSLFACDSSLVPPIVDFSRQTLILVKGVTGSPVAGFRQPFYFIKNCDGNYVMKMKMILTDAGVVGNFHWMVIVNETVQNKELVKLIFNLVDYE